MPLTKQQYESIQKDYEQLRIRNKQRTDDKIAALYQKYPQLLALENRYGTVSNQIVFATLDGNAQLAKELQEELENITERRLMEMEHLGLGPDAFAPIYSCPDCQDNGYLRRDGEAVQKCHCLLDKEQELLYDQSHIRSLMETNNFAHLSYDHKEDQDLEALRRAVDISRDFVDHFATGYTNLVFYGTVGTGKSFLSCCIAAELLKTHHSVLYMSSQKLFDTMAAYQFSNDYDREEKEAFSNDLYDCDLLILDDLGTELTNNFVESALFSCINERYLRKKPIIISTNLGLSEIRDRYSDRIFSRITGTFQFCRLTGVDLRMVYRQH